MNRVVERLRGGDRRSIGQADIVAKEAIQDANLLEQLVQALFEPDPVVRMRAADALEKATQKHPELLRPFKKQLLELLTRAGQQELCWHLAQMVPRLELTANEQQQAVENLKRYLQHRSTIVRVCALQALTDIAQKHLRFKEDVLTILKARQTDERPAIRTRCKKLLLGLLKER